MLRHTGGALALLAFAAISFATFNNGAPETRTLAAVSGAAMPHVQSSSVGSDYLPAVCVQGHYSWQSEKLPIKVFITSGNGTPGYRDSFPGMVRTAFDRWVGCSDGKLSWHEVSDAASADVKVVWTTQVTQRATGTEAGETNAYTQLNKATGKGTIYGARMLFLTQLNGQPFSDDHMSKTILHETGHALGLQGHSPNRTDIMYYSINHDQTDLTRRDQATLARLYEDHPEHVAMGKSAR